MASELLPESSNEHDSNTHLMHTFADIVRYGASKCRWEDGVVRGCAGDLTVLVRMLKETGMDLSRKVPSTFRSYFDTSIGLVPLLIDPPLIGTFLGLTVCRGTGSSRMARHPQWKRT